VPVEYTVLGPLAVWHEGTQVPLGGRKQRAVLAILLLRANQVVTPDALIDDLWGAHAPASAAHTLQVYVSRLRNALRASGVPDDVLVTRPAGYLLRVELGELDLDRFERLAAEGRRSLEAGSSERAAAKLAEALGLWKGTPFADLAFEPFALLEGERLSERRLVALEDRIDADLALGRHRDLVAELGSLVAHHPLRERLRGQQMLTLYRAGRQADALSAYRDAHEHLVGELGLEPSRELQALEQAVLRQDASLDLPAVEPSPAEAPTTPAPLAPPSRARRAPVVSSGRRALLGGAVVVLLLLGVGALAAWRSGSGAHRLAARAVHANAVVFADAASLHVLAQQDTGGRPAGIAIDGDSIWVTDAANDRVLQVSRTSHGVQERIPVGQSPSGIVATSGAIWVANTGSGSISEVNPASGTVVATIAVGNAPTALAAGAGAIWVADATDGTLRRIDPRTASVVATIPLAQPLTDLAVGGGAVWVTSSASGLLIRIDPRRNLPTQTIAVGNEPGSVAIAAGSVWVSNGPDNTISRVDDATGAVSKLNATDPGDLAVSGAYLLVARQREPDIQELDLASGSLRRTISTGSPVGAQASDGGDLAFVTLASPESHRGGTLRAVGGEDLDSIDPGEAYSSTDWQVLSLTNDGLLTYARSAGPAGATIVPDLAVSLPLIQGDGRIFTFRLRAGARYSSGAPVRPEDVRTSIERQYRAATGLAALGVPIEGAEGCSRARCDLSRGIEVDAGTRTITFRLDAPDPAFLYQLALPFGAILPARSAAVGAPRLGLPATGAYLIARYEPGLEVVLERNPRFRPWSPVAQPEGFPDRIVIRIGLGAGQQAAAVSRGTADVMLETPAQPDLDRLSRQRPLQVHSSTLPEVVALFVNTRRPPFADPAVRRALALAVDRDTVVRLLGGARRARPTCQILPASFPGYAPFCPATLNPNAGGVWHAPDLSRARRAVESSGTAGMAVTVSTVRDDPQKLAIGRYVAQVLHQLGYRTTVRVYRGTNEYYAAVGRASNRSQVGFFGWTADYQAGSAFFQPLFTCASFRPTARFNLNAAGYCDHRIDRRIAAASLLQATNVAAANRAWQSIDRSITSAVPWIPLANPTAVDYVATRVGNYQRHPTFGILLDELWVR
jgi:peptide/nickel transport system substrate-binding protein